ncbi:hypothetical protein VFPFJ_03070 [Purpureocillium lilacinum]|uniref:Uncharacterized protein n=1 Tax=Purpureocillium lilacinum TaxID=33203 RepID=A0A179HPF9_PURLI|nr:hypothetical protein VFPFJ_03070 [Purpureocillium lilacinum]OAQ91330.1 hypothetical protein VFPFJ_03070 [Purpureocillium lilacinum]
MGCSSSKPDPVAQSQPARPVPAQNLQESRPGKPAVSNYGSTASPQNHQQDDAPSEAGATSMRPEVRKQFMQAIHTALHDVPYVVIGGSALAEHGSLRETADVDVLLGEGISKGSAESLLVKRSSGRLVRLGRGRLGFVWRDGTVFQLDLTEDRDVDLPFDINTDTQVIRGTRVATLAFLLNSKAHAWQTRVPFESDYEQKRGKDARDIAFCLRLLKGQTNIDPKRLNWVYNNYFWTPFNTAYPWITPLFRDAGLWTEETAFSSASSANGWSSRSNLSSVGSFQSQRDGYRGGYTSGVNSRAGSRTGSMGR